jgi:nicotinamide mononucleotide transporter
MAISIFGWITWSGKKEQGGNKIETSWSPLTKTALTAAVTIVFACILTFCISNFHKWMPQIFMEQADFPLLDAFTTVMSFTAMYLTTIRKNAEVCKLKIAVVDNRQLDKTDILY